MTDEQKIEFSNKVFNDAINNLKFLEEERRQLDSMLLQVKIGFTAFFGLIFTIFFNNRNEYPQYFLITLLGISFLIFLLLLIELGIYAIDVKRQGKKQEEFVILAQVDRIVRSEEDRYSFYKDMAMREMWDRDKVSNKIVKELERKTPLLNIINNLSSKNWPFYLFGCLWIILILSIPILILSLYF